MRHRNFLLAPRLAWKLEFLEVPLSKTWEKWAARYDGMQRRERIMVLGAVLVCLAVIVNALLIDPLTARKKMLRGQIAGDTTQIQELQRQVRILVQNGQIDPDAVNKAKMIAAQSRLLAVDASLDTLRQGFVTPEKMPQLLESLLKKNGQLKLVSLKTLPVSDLLASTNGSAPSGGASKPAPSVANDLPVFRHGVELTVEGRYLDLLDYLVALEQLPWNMLWSKVALAAGGSGTSSLTLTVYTLSLDKAWLSL